MYAEDQCGVTIAIPVIKSGELMRCVTAQFWNLGQALRECSAELP